MLVRWKWVTPQAFEALSTHLMGLKELNSFCSRCLRQHQKVCAELSKSGGSLIHRGGDGDYNSENVVGTRVGSFSNPGTMVGAKPKGNEGMANIPGY